MTTLMGHFEDTTGVHPGDAADWVFGDQQSPGLLGTGQYRPVQTPIDANAGQIPGAQDTAGRLQQGATDAAGRAGATSQAAQMDGGAQQQLRDQQSALANALMAQASGQGPSLAQQQLKQATDRGIQQQMAAAAAQGGAGRGGALLALNNQASQARQQAASDSAGLALNEQLGARNQLGQVLAGARGQDMAYAGQNAQLQQQTNLANQQAEMQQRGMNDNLVSFYTQQGMSLAQAQQQAAMQLQQLQVQQNLGMNQIAAGAYSDAAKNRQAAISNGSGAIGALASLFF
jgi:hypothetical protein